MQDNVLILERASQPLKPTKERYVFEGMFTQFGVRNRNGRIYEKEEFMPHFQDLKEKCKNGGLLGEMDHPKRFEVAYEGVSHVIEDLNYDNEKNIIVGKLRLLDTPNGKILKALVDEGITLKVSSRAAGIVESDGRVKLKQVYTYDMVCEGGFAGTEMKRILESSGQSKNLLKNSLINYADKFGYNPKNITIVPINEVKGFNKDKTNSNSDNDVFKKFFDYTNENFKILNDKINKISNLDSQSADINIIKEYLSKLSEQVNSFHDYHSEHVDLTNKLLEYQDYTSSTITGLEKFTNYLSENLDKSISYQNYSNKKINKITEADQKYNNYLKSILEKLISYTDKQSNVINKKHSKDVKYFDYIKGVLESNVNYTDYVKNGLNSVIQHNDYLKENLQNNINYSDYQAKSISEALKNNKDLFGKSKRVKQLPITEKETKKLLSDSKKINENIDSLIEKVSKERNLVKIQEQEQVEEYPFLKFLNENQYSYFNSLNENQKQLISEDFENNGYADSNDTNYIWNNFFKKNVINKWLTEAPQKYKAVWNNLDENYKDRIRLEASRYNLETKEQIDYFWDTRGINEYLKSQKGVQINEVYSKNKIVDISENETTTIYSENMDKRIDDLFDQIKQGKFIAYY